MPLSSAANLTPILMHILHFNPRPQRILDLGCLYGAALRQYMDVGEGRLGPFDWTIELVGVEGFIDYSNPAWRLYNEVYWKNFLHATHWDSFVDFDLVLLLDTLEHTDKKSGTELMEHLLAKNNRVIVSVPQKVLPQQAVNGNVLEIHQSEWSELELTCMRPAQVIHRGVCLIVDIKGDYSGNAGQGA